MRPLLYAVPLLLLAAQGPTRIADLPAGRFEAAGACDVRPESVGCWNMDGAPAPDLTETCRALFARGTEVRFQIGRKNRFLVVRRPTRVYRGYSFGDDSVGSESAEGSDSPYDFVPVAAEARETRAVLRLTASARHPVEETLAFKEGATVTLQGRRIEVGASAPNGAGPGGPRSWTVVLGIEEPGENGPPWEFVPMDAAGFPIRYVDLQGKPLSPAKATLLEPAEESRAGSGSSKGSSGPKLAPNAAEASFQLYGQTPDFRAASNVDPRSIASLRIRAVRQVSAELGPFPLDPAR